MDTRLKRIWYSEGEKSIGEYSKYEEINETHILLVNAPLTFGHSQIIVKNCSDELNGYEKSIGTTWVALRTYNSILNSENVSELLSKYQFLSKFTRTSGAYIKMLILRASAGETKGTFKVHLIPYFESHKDQCKHRFRSEHPNSDPTREGGLLGWLGMRESQVDLLYVDLNEVLEIYEPKFLLDGLANEFRSFVRI